MDRPTPVIILWPAFSFQTSNRFTLHKNTFPTPKKTPIFCYKPIRLTFLISFKPSFHQHFVCQDKLEKFVPKTYSNGFALYKHTPENIMIRSHVSSAVLTLAFPFQALTANSIKKEDRQYSQDIKIILSARENMASVSNYIVYAQKN